MKYFSGTASQLGTVSALPCSTFSALCAYVSEPVRLTLTRADFFALPDKDRKASLDQNRAKMVRYLVPAEFSTSPSQRVAEHAVRCNLIFLDIDDANEAKRLLRQDWGTVLGGLGHMVWHTLRSKPEAPRLRVMVSADGLPTVRYVEAARTVAAMIGMTHAPSGVTFHAVQPMFLPTVFADEVRSPVEAAGV